MAASKTAYTDPALDDYVPVATALQVLADTDAALDTLLAKAREAGFTVTREDELLALPAADFVAAVWASSPPLPVDADYRLFLIYTGGSIGKPKGVDFVGKLPG